MITGAGVSVPSGLRPYRGSGGRWTQEGTSAMAMATASYFFVNQRQAWSWNLARRTEVMHAEPNDAHCAIVELERTLGDRFVLITQNVDRLHLRAGSSPERMIEIHGYLEGMRCMGVVWAWYLCHLSSMVGLKRMRSPMSTWNYSSVPNAVRRHVRTC